MSKDDSSFGKLYEWQIFNNVISDIVEAARKPCSASFHIMDVHVKFSKRTQKLSIYISHILCKWGWMGRIKLLHFIWLDPEMVTQHEKTMLFHKPLNICEVFFNYNSSKNTANTHRAPERDISQSNKTCLLGLLYFNERIYSIYGFRRYSYGIGINAYIVS